MEQLITLQTEHHNLKHDLKIDNSTNHKNFTLIQTQISEPSKNNILNIDLDIEEGTITINGIQFNGLMKDLLLKYINQL